MAKKFGTLKGVFIPSSEAILGTVLFLLMPVLVADLGFPSMLLIVLIAHTVTIATSFSLADCATNINRIEGGGMYALSKLSLGKAMGGSIGIMLYFAQTASIGFYAVGFAAPLHGLLKPYLDFIPFFQGISPEEILFQKQIIATFFLFIFFLIVMAGADFTLKIQSLIMVILLLSIASIFISPLVKTLTFEGLSVFNEKMNFASNRPLTLGVFFTSFTQFFPAVTGISTGIGMSGDLKNPRKSIVKGTFLAVFFTMIIYLLITVLYSKIDPSVILEGYQDGLAQGVILTELLGIHKSFPENWLGLFVFLGVIFATGSSALSVFMTGPRTAQYLAMDNILPKKLLFLSKDFKKSGSEPRFAILLSLGFALLIVWMGDINFAAIVVGILFLVVYGWVNGSAFLERISKNPSFRPTFKSHWLISLYGFLACIFAICLFNWKIGLFVFISQFILFGLIQKYKTQGNLEGVWWGVLYSIIGYSLNKLRSIVQGSKNWRPLITSITLASESESWQEVLKLSDQIASYSGLVNRFLVYDEKVSGEKLGKYEGNLQLVKYSGNLTDCIQTIVQTSQQAGINSNTLLLDYHPKMDTARILRTALDLDKNILMYKEGLEQGESRLDIWWRGERNGNLMALIAFIINRSRVEKKTTPYIIRIIRKLSSVENAKASEEELKNLFRLARISGEILIIPHSDKDFIEEVRTASRNASMIMLGLPGNYMEKADKPLFKLNEFFFSKEIEKYMELPPVLFVRSAGLINLTED